MFVFATETRCVCLSVYRVEDEDESLLQFQYTRNDGKAYRAPKGKLPA